MICAGIRRSRSWRSCTRISVALFKSELNICVKSTRVKKKWSTTYQGQDPGWQSAIATDSGATGGATVIRIGSMGLCNQKYGIESVSKSFIHDATQYVVTSTGLFDFSLKCDDNTFAQDPNGDQPLAVEDLDDDPIIIASVLDCCILS